MIDRARVIWKKIVQKAFFFFCDALLSGGSACVCEYVMWTLLWRHQQRRESWKEKVQFTLYRMCFDCKLPFSTLSVNGGFFRRFHDLTFSSQESPSFKRRHSNFFRNEMAESRACVCHHVSLNYIFFFFSISMREANESHICFFFVDYISSAEDIEFQFFLSYSSELACVCEYVFKLRDWFDVSRKKRKKMLIKLVLG